MNTNRPRRTLRWILGTGLTAFVFAGCHHEDPPRARPAGPGLGNEIFGALCDRVGAQALREDLTGGSYHAICHGDALTVDVSALPPAADAKVRAQATAKVEALARQRTALVAALDVVFPDDKVVGKDLDNPDPSATCNPISGKARRDQLQRLLTRLLPTDSETVPASSRALAASFEPLMSTSEPNAEAARVAMTHLAARRGYMPPELAAGLAGNLLSAPRLRDMLGATMHLVSPNSSPYGVPNKPGIAYDALKSFLSAVKDDLKEPSEIDPPLTSSFDASSGRTILSRPRTGLELVREVLLSEDAAFSNGPPLFVVRRDARGMAVVAKKDGKIPAPFVDANNDGLADVDALGRFVLTNGQKAGDPFVGDQRDPAYEYIDARKTAGSAMLRHLAPLADPDGGKESLLAAVEALAPMLRAGEGREAVLDIVHSVAQVTADPATDELLTLVGQLFKTQPQLMARVTGNLLDAKAVFDAHPEAKLPSGSTLFDELLDVVLQISREPGLLEDMLASLADDRALFLSEALPPLLKFKDRMSYDRQNLNGPPMNFTTNKVEGPKTLVDRTRNNTGLERSIFQRFLQIVDDTSGVTACNKDGGILYAATPDGSGGWGELALPGRCSSDCQPRPSTDPPGLPLMCTCPAGQETRECNLFMIQDLSAFYLRSIVGKAQLHFRNVFAATSLSPDAFRKSTGLDGMAETAQGEDLKPEPRLLNRLVFFDVDNDSKNPADKNYRTNYTINQLQGAHIGSAACAERSINDPAGDDPEVIDPPVPGGVIHGLRTCQPGQYVDQRNRDTIFALEYNHGYESLAPLAGVFVDHGQEGLFVKLLSVLNKHWSVPGGVVNAEPALAEALSGDLAASLVAMAKATNAMKIKRCAASSTTTCEDAKEVTGPQVLAEGLRGLVDSDYAWRGKVAGRQGQTAIKGRPLTLINLVREAFDREEKFLDTVPARRDQWLAARSRIVDEFLSIKGRGPEAAFVDPGIPQLMPVVIELLRSQRIAECKGSLECPSLRVDLAKDVEETLKKPVTNRGLDLLDYFLRYPPVRRELGLLTGYLTSQSDPLAGAGDVVGPPAEGASPSSTPFSDLRGPGVLDQSIAAFVDMLGALGDLKDIQPLYPILADALDHVDPQLELLSRLNARSFDGNGRELCSEQMDPEGVVADILSRLSLPITVPGQPRRPAIQIFLEAIADVNRVAPELSTPLEQADYANVFKNTHELLTDPASGLEQLYASVKRAVEN